MKALLIALMFSAIPCREQNLARFWTRGSEVAATVVGASDPCDHFGGAYARSPKYKVYVYVNFNIRADIELDVIDEELNKRSPEIRDYLREINVAVVDVSFMKRHFVDAEASLNWAGDTLFVSERVAARKAGLTKLFQEFYSSP